ncbi:MAG TPA: alpha/beta fold hydrolase [Thermoanaerobaculia bacterium]|nr:alpha/beta fold hydrolase [Thermoanaerobaculia bacterium]
MKRFLPLFFLFVSGAFAADGTLQTANLGDFVLDTGQVIRDCRIGYRTYGELQPDRSNVIVVTTWFGGTTAGLAGWIGPGKLYDTSRYYVISIDALGDGVSSSPSNSSTQPGRSFPEFTMRDLVRSQHQLLTHELGLDHVYAVSGLSMGGMQTFQWAVTFPDFMDKAVPIVGTPKQTAYDLLLWKTELALIDSPLGLKAAADINEMHLHTPAWIASHVDDVDKLMQSHEQALRKLDPFDYAALVRAMIGIDIGSPEGIHAKMFVVVSLQDQMVNPAPARELARVTKSPLLTLTGDCGHLATACEEEILVREVTRFLNKR